MDFSPLFLPRLRCGGAAPLRRAAAHSWGALLCASAAAAALSLLAGTVGTALYNPAAGAVALFGMPALGLLAAAGAGLAAWQLADCAAHPRLPGSLFAALPVAALLPLLLAPGIGSGALTIAAGAAILAGRRDRRHHVVALLVQCAAFATLAGGGAPGVAELFTCATILAAGGIALHARARIAANDNPETERTASTSWLPVGPECDTRTGDSQPGKWGVS